MAQKALSNCRTSSEGWNAVKISHAPSGMENIYNIYIIYVPNIGGHSLVPSRPRQIAFRIRASVPRLELLLIEL